jgi:Cytochrome c oxidase caa3 assembly factor (Caa3_CtaG)
MLPRRVARSHAAKGARCPRSKRTAVTLAMLTVALLLPASAGAEALQVGHPKAPASAWNFDPAALTLLSLAATFFVRAFWCLRARGRRDHAPWGRVILFALALTSVAAALLSPLDAIADDYLISAHMLQHLLLGDVAPALSSARSGVRSCTSSCHRSSCAWSGTDECSAWLSPG